jgi:hypothetical protein
MPLLAITADGFGDTATLTDRALTLSDDVPELEACVESPA